MINKTIKLVLISSLISAGLLFLGTTVMGKYSPVLASSQNALVAGTEAEELTKNNTSLPIQTLPGQPLTVGITSTSGTIPVSSVTIAELLANPDQYFHIVITLNGIATQLGDNKFLLNDGTGQILIEVEDDLVKYAIMNGLSIAVTGKLDDSSGQYGYELDACTLTDETGTLVVDDCEDDDISDDMDDDSNDDMDDDSNDDMDDDSNDDMDDDSNDDMDDDSNDDMDDDSNDDMDDDSDDDVDDDNNDDVDDDSDDDESDD